jgi:hypothetical protein
MVCALLAACNGDGGGDDTPPPAGVSDSEPDVRRYDRTRTIQVGIWWDPTDIYDSNRNTLPNSEANPIMGQRRMDNMRAIEERYNVRLEFVDMTFQGVQESISTSVMAGSPDVDIYCMDLNFGIPYVVSNYCMPISSYAQAGSDIFTDQGVFTPINIAGMPEDYLLRTSPPVDLNSIYQLGYNWDILQEFNQPSPQDLWDDDKWTWDAWLDIMRNTTDSVRGTYGWSGGHVLMLSNLLISNGTGIALTDTEGLTSPATLQVLDFIYKMYNEYNVGKPWDQDIEYWDNNKWDTGNIAFFTWVAWLAQRNGVSKGFGTDEMIECDYTIRVVHWPIGPSGNKATNRGANLVGNVYMIPSGTPDADIVYDVFYDYHNWYGYDPNGTDADKEEALFQRNDAAYWVESYFTDDFRGFEMVLEAGERPQLDMWDSLAATNADNARFGIGGLLDGSATPAQLSEQWRLIMQDYIDIAYGKK